MNSIKFIVEVVTSKRDINSNCYHYATVTKTDTGETISGVVGGADNPKSHLADLGFDFEEIKSCESVIPIRQFDRLIKGKSFMELKELAAFTGVTVWHLTDNDAKTTLCNAESGNMVHAYREYSGQKLDSGVWCNTCRRFRQVLRRRRFPYV